MSSVEIGYAAPADSFNFPDEKDYRLQWPRRNDIYSEMSKDAHVKSLLKAVTLPILRTTWRLDPNGAPDEMVKVFSEDLRLPILGDDTPVSAPRIGGAAWSNHLYWALKCLTYGHAFFEIIFESDSDPKRDRLRKIAPRPAKTLDKINVAKDGGLISIEQKPLEFTDSLGRRARWKNIVIPVDNIVAYINDPEDFSWTGESILRAAYTPWRYKLEMQKLEASVARRNGMGIPVYKGSTTDSNELSQGKKLATSLAAGKSSGVAVQEGADVKLLGVTGQVHQIRPMIEAYSAEILISGLAHFLNLDGGGGSYALASVQESTFTDNLQSLADNIADTANQFLIGKMARVMFDTDTGPLPKITFDPIGSKIDLTPEMLSLLVNAGIIIPDKDLEEEVRRRGNLPPKGEFSTRKTTTENEVTSA